MSDELLIGRPGTDRIYDSHAAFYEDVYSHAIRERRPAGRVGAVILASEQEAGDWSDAATPDIVLVVQTSRRLRGIADCGGGRFAYSADAGEAVLIPPGCATSMIFDGRHSIRALAIPYGRLTALAGSDAGLPEDGDFGHLHAGPWRDPEVLGLVDRLWQIGQAPDRYAGLVGDGVILETLGALLRLRSGGTPVPARGGLAARSLLLVDEYLRANLARDVSLAELAAIANLSASHFCRAYKQSTGRTPGQALIERRVARAKELLKTTDLPIIEVGAACGYDSPSAFAAVFRRATGMTPRGWRREARR